MLSARRAAVGGLVRILLAWECVTSDETSPCEAPEPPPIPPTDRGAFGTAAATAASAPTRPGERATAFNVSAWAVARYTLVIAFVLLGLYVLWMIQEVLLLMLLAILLATAIEPFVDRLRAGPFSRGQGILIVYTAIFTLIGLVGFLVVPSLVEQGTQFVDNLPARIGSLTPQVEQIQYRPLRDLLLNGIGRVAPAIQRSLREPVPVTEPAQIVEVGGAFAHTLFSLVTVFLLAFYWLTERSAIKRALLRLVPSSRAREVNATWLEVESKLGGWVRGQLLIMGALGILAFATFLTLGLPNPLLLAALAGLAEIVPIVGPWIAFAPALLVALAVDPTKALMLLPIVIVIQQIEGNVLVPRVMGHTTGISPLTVILGILIGGILYGIAGAFLAVPVAAALQVILNHVLRPAMSDEGDFPVPDDELEGEVQPDRDTIARLASPGETQ